MPADDKPGKPHNKPDNNRRHGAHAGHTNRGNSQKPRGNADRGNAQRPKANKPQDRDQRGGTKPNQRDRGPRRDDSSRAGGTAPQRRDDKRQRPQDGGRGAPAGRDNRGARPDTHGSRPDKRGQRPEDRGARPDRRGPDNRGQRPDNRGPRPDNRSQRSDNRGPRPDNRGQRPDKRTERFDKRGQRPDDRGPRSEDRGRRPDDRRRQDGPPPKQGGRSQNGPGDRRVPGRGPNPRPKQGDERPQKPPREREHEPELPAGATADELHEDVRRELRSMPKNLAETVAAHLVAAGQLIEAEPAKALEHARYARKRASRVAAVREANGLTAYHNGQWNEALSELRAARRMSGDPSNLPVMADCERALGRPQRALDLSRDPETPGLERSEAVELTIVAAGARRDLGQVEASVVALQLPELESQEQHPWNARLFYAYADNLLAEGRVQEAFTWFVHAADADDEGETDAPDRLDELFVQLGGDSGIDELLSGVGDEDQDDDESPEVSSDGGETSENAAESAVPIGTDEDSEEPAHDQVVDDGFAEDAVEDAAQAETGRGAGEDTTADDSDSQ